MATHFIKLGGSLITDKTRPLTPRPLVIERLAREIAVARRVVRDRRFLLSHGSGGYGHAMGRRHRTREGVRDDQGWRGFAQTAHAAAQLNRLVVAALVRAGVPAIGLAPSALAYCHDGEIAEFWAEPVRRALDAGLVPVVYGDVALDEVRGGTIVSTEQVLAALIRPLRAERVTLAGLVDGVFEADPARYPTARRIPRLSVDALPALATALGGSHGIDVTGGMAAKIQLMADLLTRFPHLRIHLLSGEIPGHLQQHLIHPNDSLGTVLHR
ncbi:MAG: uridylate kinase [Chloroflexi bacterium]|nr:uridylate kinase [Chloroflexota bacterium]